MRDTVNPMFRAWDTKEKKWLFGYELLGGFSLIGEIVLLGELNSVPLERWNEIMIMQFTGLTDKNGKEIYDGDIVKYTKHEGYLLDDFVAEVFWKDVQWSLGNPMNGKQHDVNLAEVDELQEDLLSHLEVIGNYYENPELLK